MINKRASLTVGGTYYISVDSANELKEAIPANVLCFSLSLI